MPGAPALAAVMLLSRLGGIMWQIALVLFVLQRFHSPGLAGLAGAAGLLPGLLLSPLAGALLDRHGRVPLMIFDFVLAGAGGFAIWGLATASLIAPWLLLLLLTLSSLTLPLGATGARSLVPLMMPRELWDLANGVDLALYRVANIAAPALAGLLVAWIGGAATLGVIGLIWLAAAAAMLLVREPRLQHPDRGHVLADAWVGLRYVLGHPVLRGIAVVWTLANIGFGVAQIAVPVTVLGRLHGRPTDVGLIYSAAGLAGLAANLVAGSIRTEGRERRLIAGAVAAEAVSWLALAVAASVPAVMMGMMFNALATSVSDVTMFGLRQRVADPAWMGRAMSISMMLNSVGAPIGAGLAGPAIALGAPLALAGAGAVTLGAAAYAAVGLRAPASQPRELAVLES